MRTVMSISLPEKVADQLEQFIQETGRNKSDVVRESISLYLWRRACARPSAGWGRGPRRPAS